MEKNRKINNRGGWGGRGGGRLFGTRDYTIEFENENKLSFLDVTITNTGNDSYDFKIFRKTSITSIKLSSNIAPHIAMVVFKGFLTRAYEICTEK